MKEKDLRCFLFFFPYRPFLIHTEILCPVFICFFLFFFGFGFGSTSSMNPRTASKTQQPTKKKKNEEEQKEIRVFLGSHFVWCECVCVCVCVCECALTGPRLVLIVFVSAFPKNGFTNYLQKYNSSIEIHRQSIVS